MTNPTRDQITFKQEDTQFDLWRLGDGEYQQLRQHSLPVPVSKFANNQNYVEVK